MKISEIIIVLQGVYIHYIVSQWRENGFETGKVTIFYNRDGDLQKVVIGIIIIKLLESPIPAPPPPPAAAAPSQKASSDDISGTKRGTIDPLVSKRPETNSE